MAHDDLVVGQEDFVTDGEGDRSEVEAKDDVALLVSANSFGMIILFLLTS